MQVSAIRGRIARRILVNLRMKPEVVQAILPAPFRPQLVDGWAIGGICLIRLEQIRLPYVPAQLGTHSENAAHRFAVTWTDENGKERNGVYIPRRDTASLLNLVMSKGLFPAELHKATFEVIDGNEEISITMRAEDGVTDLDLVVRPGTTVASTSVFQTAEELSNFFRAGDIGFSPREGHKKLDSVRLFASSWDGVPLTVDTIHSNYFTAPRFPEGSFEIDSAFLMRDIEHQWLQENVRCCEEPILTAGCAE